MQNDEEKKVDNSPVDTLATTAEIDTLKELIEAAIGEYSNKGHKNKKGAVIVQGALISLSALTTIFLGWKFPNSKTNFILINLALVSSSVVSGLNVINAFFDYKDLWAQYKVSRNQLKTLRAELLYIQASYNDKITKNQVKEIFEKYKNICNETNTTYQQLRMAKDGTEK